MIGFFFCLISFFACLFIAIIDFKQDADEEYIDEPEKINAFYFSAKCIKEFNLMVWLLLISTVLTFGSLTPFNNIENGFLTQTYFSELKNIQLAQEYAGRYMSVKILVAAIMVPVFGAIIDRFGQRAYLTLFCSFLGFFSFLSFFYIHPLLCLIFLGLTYSLFSSIIWPVLFLLVDKNQTVIILNSFFYFFIEFSNWYSHFDFKYWVSYNSFGYS